jgi:hypothetical protein
MERFVVVRVPVAVPPSVSDAAQRCHWARQFRAVEETPEAVLEWTALSMKSAEGISKGVAGGRRGIVRESCAWTIVATAEPKATKSCNRW